MSDFEKEIEIRFEANEDVISKLKNIKLEPHEELDEYFFTEKTLDNDIYLRFRQKKGKIFLNLKVITLGGENAKIVNEADEISTEVSNEQYEEMKKIFNVMFSIKLNIRKIRRRGYLNECEILLDSVDGLGEFLEIEGPKEKILEVCQQIGLNPENNINKQKGYVKMMIKKRGLI